MEFKKLLLVTDGFLNDGTGSGITLFNLFKGWELSKINVFSAASDKANMGLIKGTDAFQKNSKRLKKKGKSNNSNDFNLRRFISKSFLRPYLTPFAPIVISKDSKKQIIDFKPDIIYCPVSDIYSIRRLIKISNYAKKAKITTVFFDDLIDRYESIKFSKLYKRIHFFFLKKILSISNNAFVCSEAMRDEYEVIFKRNFSVVSNPVDLNVVKDFRFEKKDKNDFKITYAGTVNSKNIENLRLMGNVIKQINNLGEDISFHLLTFGERLEDLKKEFKAISNKIHVSEVPELDQDLFSALGSSSILYLPLDFTKESIKSIRLSYLTKQPLYMSLGVPILVHGPEEIHIVRHSIENNYAEVVTSDSFDELFTSVMKHLNDYDVYLARTDNGLKYATENHSIDMVQRAFYKKIINEIS
tara:strand:- start:14465 stop:15706 length:1242 start_codon:yes stop_codon:yes gene_type:complete